MSHSIMTTTMHDPTRHYVTCWAMDIHCRVMVSDGLVYHHQIPDTDRAALGDLCTLLYTTTRYWVEVAGAIDDEVGDTTNMSHYVVPCPVPQADDDDPLSAHIADLYALAWVIDATLLALDTAPHPLSEQTDRYQDFRRTAQNVSHYIAMLATQLDHIALYNEDHTV